MTDTPSSEAGSTAVAGNAAPGQGQFAIHKVYLQDVSVESPNCPDIFSEKWNPDVDVQITSSASDIGDNNHNIAIGITVTVKSNDKTAYLVEVHQAGVFHINGVTEQQLHHMVYSYCPNILFPYAREAISDLIMRAGFPQMLIAPVNFDAMYMQRLKEQQEAAKQAGSESSDSSDS